VITIESLEPRKSLQSSKKSFQLFTLGDFFFLIGIFWFFLIRIQTRILNANLGLPICRNVDIVSESLTMLTSYFIYVPYIVLFLFRSYLNAFLLADQHGFTKPNDKTALGLMNRCAGGTFHSLNYLSFNIFKNIYTQEDKKT
jgi:hypothetical protein